MILALAMFSMLNSAGAKQAPEVEIRVRVQRERSAIEVTGYGLRIAPPSNYLAAAIPDSNMTKAQISRTKNGQWLVKWPNNEIARFDSDRLAVRGQMLRLGPEAVPYDLELMSGGGQKMDVVARLDLETYLAGVLPSEMPAVWPVEALKAQAVAARSFVMRTAYERRNRHFDVDSTVMDQVYKFLTEAKSHPEWKERVARVIDETRGQVLRDRRGRVVKAFYSADCGCQTEDPKFVWGKVDNLQSVKDPTCGLRPVRKWDLSLDKSEVRDRLLPALNLPPQTDLRTLQIATRTPSGRVSSVVAAVDLDGSVRQVMMNAQEFRKIFGFDKIRSTDFKVRWLGKKMQIMGEGVGHAVGLCQTGAKALAEQGKGYEEILKLYYPKVRLAKAKTPKSA